MIGGADGFHSLLKVTVLGIDGAKVKLGFEVEPGDALAHARAVLDVEMVGYLLGKGANLQAVTSYLNRKLTEEELAFLTELISATQVVAVNGIHVAEPPTQSRPSASSTRTARTSAYCRSSPRYSSFKILMRSFCWVIFLKTSTNIISLCPMGTF